MILVNVNPAYRLSELEFALNKVGCRALVLAPSFKSSDYGTWTIKKDSVHVTWGISW